MGGICPHNSTFVRSEALTFLVSSKALRASLHTVGILVDQSVARVLVRMDNLYLALPYSRLKVPNPHKTCFNVNKSYHQ